MKKNPRLEERRKRISKDIDKFVERSFQVSDRIHEILQKNSKGQKYLADKLGKSESEISKWMSGTHNFTIRTVTAIESVLNEDILVVAGKEKVKYLFIKVGERSGIKTTTIKSKINKVNKEAEYTTTNWNVHNKITGTNYDC